ncbi:MAG: phosphatase PAP2 family protein [Marinilabiliaceae bacterium]|nr:phosphatase PAP2 family protein [Marinilabiliaceae bacterium]
MNKITSIAFFALLFCLPSFAKNYNKTSQSIEAICNLTLKKPELIKPAKYNHPLLYQTHHTIYALSLWDETKTEKTKWYNSKAARISYVPAALFALGTYSWQYRKNIRELRNRYIPTYENRLDDYIQYTPALAVYGLNLAGVQGKHSLERATVSYALSGLMTFGLVTSMKYSIKELRPDESSRNSFPSGHTANAFMNATFFHKEYGQYRSPLYSFFGYALASWTGVMRQLNNRHWMPDVLVGAGIGVLMTELAYVITDRKYGNKGLNSPHKYSGRTYQERNPSFLNVKIGYSSADGDLAKNNDDIYAHTGFTAGLEGAYFFNRRFGIGGQILITSFSINSDNLEIIPELRPYISKLNTQAMGSAYYMAGPYFHTNLGNEFSLMMNVTAGYSRGAEGSIIGKLTPANQQIMKTKEIPLIQYNPGDAFAWSPGGQVWKRLNDRIALGLYGHYIFNTPEMDTYDITDYSPETKEITRTYTDTFEIDFSQWSVGFTINALF